MNFRGGLGMMNVQNGAAFHRTLWCRFWADPCDFGIWSGCENQSGLPLSLPVDQLYFSHLLGKEYYHLPSISCSSKYLKKKERNTKLFWIPPLHFSLHFTFCNYWLTNVDWWYLIVGRDAEFLLSEITPVLGEISQKGFYHPPPLF